MRKSHMWLIVPHGQNQQGMFTCAFSPSSIRSCLQNKWAKNHSFYLSGAVGFLSDIWDIEGCQKGDVSKRPGEYLPPPLTVSPTDIINPELLWDQGFSLERALVTVLPAAESTSEMEDSEPDSDQESTRTGKSPHYLLSNLYGVHASWDPHVPCYWVAYYSI